MGLVKPPTAVLSDDDVADALSRAVRLINPVLDVLADADPFGLKARTHHLGAGAGPVDKALNALASALNVTRVPGTRAWANMDMRHRVNWWVRRVGAVNTVFVAFPGIFGILVARLPVQDLLGFSNQAIVLCAVAREHDITDYQQQVRILAQVLCNRTLDAEAVAGVGDADASEAHDPKIRRPFALAHTLWHLTGIMRAIGAELGERPQPKRIVRYLGVLPVIGGIAGYLGEVGALRRAVKAEEQRIADPSGAAGGSA